VLVALGRFPLEPVDDENEPEPVGPVGAETRPRDGAPQRQRRGDDAGLLEELATQARDGVLARLKLPAEAVVLALVVVARALTVHEQHLVAAADVAEGADDGPHRHLSGALPDGRPATPRGRTPGLPRTRASSGDPR